MLVKFPGGFRHFARQRVFKATTAASLLKRIQLGYEHSWLTVMAAKSPDPSDAKTYLNDGRAGQVASGCQRVDGWMSKVLEQLKDWKGHVSVI